jgi:hypothetical protein
MRSTSIGDRLLGSVNLLAGLFVTRATLLELRTEVQAGGFLQPMAGLALLGACGGALLAASGGALWARSAIARRAAVSGAGMTLAAHATAWGLGVLGIPGVVLGVLYPAALLLLMWTRPSLGSGAAAATAPSAATDGRNGRSGALRVLAPAV